MTSAEALAQVREAGMVYDYPSNWIIDTAKRLPTEHAYADYAAWADWLTRQLDESCAYGNPDTGLTCTETGSVSDCVSCRLFCWWEDLDHVAKARLYGIFCQAVTPPKDEI